MSGETVRIDVAPEDAAARLDVFLASRIPGPSRSALRRLILEGHVLVDGRPASKPGQALRAGSTVSVEIPPPPPPRPEPEPIPVDVVHEDDALLVVAKPAGLVVHPGHGRRSGTLVNALLGRGTPLAGVGGPDRPGIVHRLDRETSGLLIVAKTDAAHRALAAAFARREIRKTYVALVWGRPAPPEGAIDLPIGRSRADPTKMSVRAPRGRAAVTLYRTIETLPGFALLEVDLVTGRTHQIRVHLTARHHPIVGDTRYGGRPWRSLRDGAARSAVEGFDRLALHAARIAFVHPTTGRRVRFEAPLPPDFRNLLRVLRREAP